MKVWVCLLTTVLFTSSAFAERFEVRVAERSTVAIGEPVRLGTLLQGEIPDQELSHKVYNTVVFDAITSEEEKVFRSEELALTLRQKLSFQDLQRLSVKVPEQVRVRAQRNFLHAGDLKRQIADQAHGICLGCTVEFDDLKIPDLNLRGEILQTHLDTSPLKSAGGFLLPLHVQTSQGKSVHWITGRLSFFKDAPVAKRLIRAGERLEASDFEMRRTNVSFVKDGTPLLADLGGKIALRTLTMGQAVFSADLKREAATQRGQTVKIIAGNESFEISTSGTAEEAGSIGDLIKVKSTDTKKIMTGLVIDRATVKLQ